VTEDLGDLSRIDGYWETMREMGCIPADAPPLTQSQKEAIRRNTLKAPPLTEAQRSRLLHLLRSSSVFQRDGGEAADETGPANR
jgi:hypothetical protein